MLVEVFLSCCLENLSKEETLRENLYTVLLLDNIYGNLS